MASTRTFGVVDDTQTGILLNGYTAGQSAEIAEARDMTGKVIELQAYSKGKTAQYSGLIDTNKGTFPEAGATITTADGEMVVESTTKTYSNTAFATGDVSCRTADSAEITPYG